MKPDFTVFACDNLRDEIQYNMEGLTQRPIIQWIDAGLHNTPDKLRQLLQRELDQCHAENVLLLFGCCGSSTVGLRAPYSNLICPRADDCMSICLGGNEKRNQLELSHRSLFFTRGYMENDCSLYWDMKKFIRRQGLEKTLDVFPHIFQEYRLIRIIRSEAYPMDDLLKKGEELADICGLICEIVDGDLVLIRKALHQEWDESFIRKTPGEVVLLQDFLTI